MATFGDWSGTGQDRFLVVLFRTQSEKTETETGTGLIKTNLAVRSFAVQFRLRTGLQLVFGPDSWTLQPKDTYHQRRATSSSPMPACPPSRTPTKRSHSTPRVSPGSRNISVPAYGALCPSIHQWRPRPDGDDPQRGRGTRPAKSSRGTRNPEVSSPAHSPQSRTSASRPDLLIDCPLDNRGDAGTGR